MFEINPVRQLCFTEKEGDSATNSHPTQSGLHIQSSGYTAEECGLTSFWKKIKSAVLSS